MRPKGTQRILPWNIGSISLLQDSIYLKTVQPTCFGPTSFTSEHIYCIIPDKPRGFSDDVAHKQQAGLSPITSVCLQHSQWFPLSVSLVLQCAYPQNLEGSFHFLVNEAEATRKAQIYIWWKTYTLNICKLLIRTCNLHHILMVIFRIIYKMSPNCWARLNCY